MPARVSCVFAKLRNRWRWKCLNCRSARAIVTHNMAAFAHSLASPDLASEMMAPYHLHVIPGGFHMTFVRLIASATCLALMSCGPSPADTAKPASQNDSSEPVASATTTVFAWPAAFAVMGDGYPKAGDPCRRLGESAITVNYLDDSAMLVGCPGAASDPAAAALIAAGGRVAGAAEGVTMISIPQGDANAGMAAAVGSQAMADEVMPADARKQ